MFKKAEKTKVKLKIALTGPSGGGKTYSALTLAKAMGKRIALIDTENASASLYADKFEFDTLNIEAPYTIPKYNAAIDAAVKGEYDVLVIDSLTHAWAGEGGLLDKKAQSEARGVNSFTAWNKLTPEHEALKAKILSANIDMICTMRSKQEYVLVENDKGKMAPQKVGLAPIQRDGMEYEFTTVFDIGIDHRAKVSKDRTAIFDDQTFLISESTGLAFMKWRNAGIDVPKPELPRKSELAFMSAEDPAPDENDKRQFIELCKFWSVPLNKAADMIQAMGVKQVTELSRAQFMLLVEQVETLGKEMDAKT